MTVRKLLVIYAVMAVIIMIGAFTLSLWGYIVLVCACFIGLQIGRAIERRKHDQDSRDGVA